VRASVFCLPISTFIDEQRGELNATGEERRQALPVAVIGAGPIGLVAAAHLVSRGETPLVLEAGESGGASVRSQAHVRLFSPWRYLVDPVALSMLEPMAWRAPEPEALRTGGEAQAAEGAGAGGALPRANRSCGRRLHVSRWRSSTAEHYDGGVHRRPPGWV